MVDQYATFALIVAGVESCCTSLDGFSDGFYLVDIALGVAPYCS